MAAAAEIFESKSKGDTLPDPFSPQQRAAMVEDIKRAYREHKDSNSLFAELLHTMGTWAARAGRLYASNHIEDLRGDVEKAMAERNAVIIREIEYLRAQVGRLDELEQRVALAEVRR